MEAPLLKVSRPVSACARCRNAKIRCDGKLPACSACERAGKSAECSSANDHFAKGKERSYVASLESRIERLEKQLALKTGGSNASQLLLGHPFSAEIPLSRRNEALDVDDLVSDFGYLSINATASGYRGFGKEMSFARLVLATACMESLPIPVNIVLPDRYSTITLVQECLRNVLTLYPVLSETALFGSLEACYEHEGQFGTPTDRWNVHMVIAISYLCRSSAKHDGHYQKGLAHVGKALEEQDFVIQPGDMASPQAILLLVIYSVLDPAHFNCWYLISVASRLLIDLGAHQEPAPTIPAKKRELRRRLFYCTYSLDRLISLSLVRALSFSDDSISLNLPPLSFGSVAPGTGGAVPQHSAAMGDAALILVHFHCAQSTCYQRLFCSTRKNLYEPWQARCRDLHELKEHFWELASSTAEAHRQILLAELYYMNILLVQPKGAAPISCPYGLALLFEYSLSYAQSVWLLCQKQKHSIACTQLELHRALEVATVFLDVLKNPSCPALSGISPQAPPIPPTVSLPAVLKRPVWEAIERAMEALTRIDQVIDVLGRKFGYPRVYNQFKAKLSHGILSLQSRQGHSRSDSSSKTDASPIRKSFG